MWTENGYPGYAVTNLTDEMLYVDKELSFLRLKGISRPYYQGLTFTESNVSTSSSHWQPFFAVYGSASTKGCAISRSEAKNLIIPPGQTMNMTIQDPIIKDLFADCDMDYSPRKDSPASRSFTESNTPISFDNILTYRVGKDGKDMRVSVGFYVFSITNYAEDAIVKKERIKIKEEECRLYKELGPRSTNYYYYNTQAAPNRFYSTYQLRNIKVTFTNGVWRVSKYTNVTKD